MFNIYSTWQTFTNDPVDCILQLASKHVFSDLTNWQVVLRHISL